MLKRRADIKSLLVKLATAALIALVVLLPNRVAEAADGKDIAKEVLAMTGARTKIVWAHQLQGGNQWGGGAPVFELVGFDTAEGKERVILPGPASYGNPSITQDGSRVVFSDVPTSTVYVVDWDGKNKKAIAPGFALCTWIHPKTRVQWVYASKAEFSSPIYRYQLDNPKIKELVWDKVVSCSSGWQVSADGTRTGSEFPHPNAGVAMLPNGPWERYGGGCEGCIAPDNSYRFFHMGGSAGHSGVMMYDAGGANKRRVPFNNFPGRGRQDSWNPRWSTHVRFLTVSSPNAGNSQEVYLGEFDENFTSVKRWIQISSRPGQDLLSHAWISKGLGYWVGEAPFTIEIPPLGGKGKWAWDYGDGTKESAAAGKHTYAKVGDYTITARQGNTLLKGRVSVLDRKAPAVAEVRVLDEKHLEVIFDEAVRLNNAVISLISGATVRRYQLDDAGYKLSIELNDPMARDDTLFLNGIFDRAREPNALETGRVKISRPPWPSDRRGLVFLWENAKARNIYLDPDDNTFQPVTLTMSGMARLDRFGAALFDGGTASTTNMRGAVARACAKSNEFSIEATLTPAAARQGDLMAPVRILTCSTYRKGREQVNLALHHEEDILALYIRNKTEGSRKPLGELQRVRLRTPAEGAPNHIVVSYAPGKLTCYVNGKEAKQTDEVKGKLNWWRAAAGERIWLGGAIKRGTVQDPWKGSIEGIAIFSRAISADEARDNYAEYAKRFADRKPLEQIEVRARLTAKTDVPEVADIAPYHSALVVCEYEIEKVLKGSCDEKKIRVARWGVVHKKKTTLASDKPGAVSVLVLEKAADHPELEEEFVADTLPKNFDLTLYVEPAPPEPGPERPAGSAKGRLSLAKSYLAAGLKDKAKAILTEIVENHPKSEHTKEAAKLLEGLKGEK